MDAGFRLLLALYDAKERHARVGRLLPDWPTTIKDEHDAEGIALREAWAAMWDVYAPACACSDNGIDMADATADTADAYLAFRPNVELAGESLTHVFAPPPDSAARHDDPPSKPL